jgi:hypothetical protein
VVVSKRSAGGDGMVVLTEVTEWLGSEEPNS